MSFFLAPKAQAFSLTLGVGTGYSFPGTVRIGFEEVELGLLSPSFLGISKLIRQESIYTAVGVGVVTGIPESFGFYGGLGWMPQIWGILHLRFEAIALAGHTGIVKGEGIGGITLEF
jgi:hypothetical protein